MVEYIPDAEPEGCSPEDPEDFDAERDRMERRRTLLAGLGWAVIGPLMVIACLRVVAHDATVELIALNAFTQWLYVPAWFVLIMGSVLHRRALAGCAGCIVLAHILWLDPRTFVAAALPEPARQASRFRVMSANLFAVNEDTDGIVQEIVSARPDLLLLQELTPNWAKQLDTPSMQALFPYRMAIVREDAFGIGLYTRVPARIERLALSDLPALRATVDLGGRKLHVYNVHTLPPRQPASAAKWSAMMTQLAEWARHERDPMLLAGDLNATPHTRWYRELLKLDLRGAHEDRGRGLATTWPNGRMPYLPIRLDHLLVSRHLAVLDVREGEGRGSDHRPVICDLALLSPPGT